MQFLSHIDGTWYKYDSRKLQSNYNFSYYYFEINVSYNLAVKQFCLKEKYMTNFILHLNVTLAMH